MTVIHKFETEEKNKSKLPKRFSAVLGFGLIVLVVLEIWVSHSLNSFGEKYQNIESLQKTLSLENEVLENEIAKESSISKIASQSASLGFSSPTNIQYIRE